MPLLLRLDDIRTRTQRRCDREGDPAVVNTEWNALISEAYRELYGEVEKTGMRFAETTLPITADGSATYTLPTDHLATIGLFRITDTQGTRRELAEIMPQERVRWSGQVGDALVYDVVGQAITLYPKPSSGNYELLYIPQATSLSTAADSTQVDVFNGDGEAFLIWATAIKSQPKGEFDVQLALAEREGARERLVDWATKRAFTQPRRRINHEVPGYYDPYGRDPINDPGGYWDRH